MSQVIFGMLATSGRITMLGISRWTEEGGSCRTIQRLYHTTMSWTALHWLFFKECFLRSEDEYNAAGDEVVVSKAGKETYGLDRLFAGLQQRVIPGLSFFTFSLVNVCEERSYPLQTTQVVKSAEGKSGQQSPSRSEKGKEDGREEKARTSKRQQEQE